MPDPTPTDPDLAPDYTALLTHAVSIAEGKLLKFNTFYPYGAVITTSGQIENHNVLSGDDPPLLREILSTLADTFSAGIAAGRWRSTALCMNVSCARQDNSGEIDALRVDLLHRSGSKVTFYIPYARTANGYTFERPFTR